MKVIMLIDMDAYFASVEQSSNPALRGKPIAVTGSDKRTVVTTSSYEARARGVKTGMNVYEAKKVCPELIIVVGNNRKYTYTCAELANLYRKYTPDVEVYSVDESFLDLTTTHHLFGGPMAIGREIKKAIGERFGLKATIGISYNKLMAKLTSDISKPDGLRWVQREDAGGILEDLPTGELWGVGRHIEKRLQLLGIRTCGELGRASVTVLRSHFGIIGERLKAMGMGLDATPVTPQAQEAKSVGHSMTLPRDISRMGEIEAYILKLSEMVGRRARKNSLKGAVVSVVIRYSSFRTFTRQHKMRVHTNDTHVIFAMAMEIIRGQRLEEAVRLLGVSISELINDDGQLSIFEEVRRRGHLTSAMDGINDKYGENTVSWALYASMEVQPGVISPAWRPTGVHKTIV